MGFNKEDVREGSVSGKDGISSCESGCYVYENEVTGMQQWHYPTPGAGAEDMDICTTPPPPPPDEPPPPPPPPPELSPPPAPFISNNLVEPLPPGTASPPLEAPPPPRITHVDLQNANVVMQHPNHLFIVEPTPQPPPNEALCAALSSFYSDLADLEPAASPQAAIIPSLGPQVAIQSIPMVSQAASMFPSPNLWATTAQPEVPEKNKKKKVKAKLTTSVGLKNKSVSSMVEKWKKVQETLDD